MGVDFEEGGNRRARREPSKSGLDRLNLSPHTTFVVEVEDMIDVHYASLTSHSDLYLRVVQINYSLLVVVVHGQ